MSYFSARFPQAASSPLANIVEFLQSINKASWYARWIATFGLAPNSDGSGGPVALGGPVGCWAPIQQLGFDFKWIQSITSKRPAYGLQDGLAAVYGDSTTWALDLNSTTALNGVPHCTFVSFLSKVEAKYIYSHDISEDALQTQTGSAERVLSGGGYSNGQLIAMSRNYTGTQSRVKYGWRSLMQPSGAPRLLDRTSGGSFSGSGLYEVAFTPALTSAEMNEALKYLAG
jgi:hypothetical protein